MPFEPGVQAGDGQPAAGRRAGRARAALLRERRQRAAGPRRARARTCARAGRRGRQVMRASLWCCMSLAMFVERFCVKKTKIWKVILFSEK